MPEFDLKSLPKLNIGIFTDSYTPYISGVVRSIETFRRDLERLGHNIYIFAPDYPNAKPEKNVFRYLSLPAPTQPGFFFPIPISFRLSFTVNNLKLDIVHVHTPFLMGSLGAVMARRFNLPLLFTYHTLYQSYTHYLPMGRNISTHIIKNWNRNFCNRCDMIIAPSIFVKDLICDEGVTKPVRVIPTGINVQDYCGNDQLWLRKRCGIAADEKILLHVGRLAREKNVGFIIDAAAELVKYNSRFKLVIVGTGTEEEELKNLCSQKKLDRHVIFTGQVTHGELLKCFAGGDIFVFASRSETQGIVLAEAKASGMPVVALNSPCMDGILTDGDDGFLVETLDAFVQKVRLLLENEKTAREMGHKARTTAVSFSAPLLAEKLAKVYYYTLLQKKDRYVRERAGSAVK